MPSIKTKTARAAREPWVFFIRNRRILSILALLLAVFLWGPTIYTNLATRGSRYDLERTSVNIVPEKQVALVLGAGLYKDGAPTPYLVWRVEAASQLYKAHRVKKLLLSGDNSRTSYSEPVAMQKLAEKLGVPSKDIVLDYAGYNTYASCYRARDIFKISSAIVVSQGYHLPRAVMTCNHLGISSIGVDAVHNQGRSWKVQYIVREWFSTDKMVLELLIQPKPAVLGKVEPIKF